MKKRLLQLDDLDRVCYLCTPDLSPDGKHTLICKRYALPDGMFSSTVFLVENYSGNEALLFEDAELARFSPCGNFIAFLREYDCEKQIWLYSRSTGDIRQLTTLRHGVCDFSWAKNGQMLCFTARLWSCEPDIFTQMSVNERDIWLEDQSFEPYVAEDLVYKMDEAYGMYDGGYTHIGTVNLSGAQKMLTCGNTFYSMPAFSHDCGSVAFYGKPHSGFKGNRSEIFVYSLTGDAMTMLDNSMIITPDAPPIFTSDNKSIIFAAYDEDDIPKLYSKSVCGGECSALFPKDAPCHGVNCKVIGRTSLEIESAAWQLSSCGRYIYFISAWNHALHVYRVSIDGEHKIEQITHGKICIHSFCAPKNSIMTYTRGDTQTIADLFCLKNGTEARLLFSNSWLDDIELSVPNEMTVKSKDGTADICGFVMPPQGMARGCKYPAVLNIHGGPSVTYSYDFWFELQYLSSSSMAVVYCDPRGSAGFGAAFMQGADSGWSLDAVDDLLRFLDSAMDGCEYIDKNLLGVTGGSYGGYTTNKIMGLTDRFKAAVTQRTFHNPVTSYGTGDIGFISASPNGPKTAKKLLCDRAANAVIGKIDRYKTPLLILHGMSDIRCGFEQGEQLFVLMRDRNPEVPCKMVAFPHENHGVSRNGRLLSQRVHLSEMTQWFKRYLKDTEAVK